MRDQRTPSGWSAQKDAGPDSEPTLRRLCNGLAGKDSLLTLRLKLALGMFIGTPFDPGVVDEMTDVTAGLLGSGVDNRPSGSP